MAWVRLLGTAPRIGMSGEQCRGSVDHFLHRDFLETEWLAGRRGGTLAGEVLAARGAGGALVDDRQPGRRCDRSREAGATRVAKWHRPDPPGRRGTCPP